MSWGHSKLLQTDVAILVPREDNSKTASKYNVSDLAVMQLTTNMESNLGIPLGIPLAALDNMQNTHSKYTRDLVTYGLMEYVDIAYTRNNSDLPKLLLKAICSYYLNTSATDYEVMKLSTTTYPSADFVIGYTSSGST
jgi:hypothetical protein